MRGTTGYLGATAIIIVALFLASRVSGVIFYSTGDPTYNTTAPTGGLAGSGWQWAGDWVGFIGTPIGPHHFLTAHHVGGSVGDSFIFGGVSYTTTAIFDDNATDLRICEVSGTFPTWAPIYRTSNELGLGLMAVGAGVGRGAAVIVNGNVAGWNWSSGGSAVRWGENSVAQVIDGGSSYGELLYSLFSASDNPNQADLANYDSSGPIFINNGFGWQLAGIALAVDGPFSTSSLGSNPFVAALFDARGLYLEVSSNPPTWELITGSAAVPSGFYATRVSARAAWIDSIVPPSNGGDAPLLSGTETAVLAASLAAIGAANLRRSKPSKSVA